MTFYAQASEMSDLHILIGQRLSHKNIKKRKYEGNKSETAMTFLLEVLDIYKKSKKRHKHQEPSCLPSAWWTLR